jgi:GNAT superfamily N-acetyltransferase
VRVSWLRSPRGGGRANRTTAPREKFAIREARPSDAEALGLLLTELGYPTTEAQAGARLERLRAERATKVLVAEAGRTGDVAGVAGVRAETLIEHDRPGARLIALVVAERFRRRGVARALVRRAEEEARALGCSRIVLTSADHREDAHAFYLAAGYEQTGRRFAKDLGAEAASRLGA